MERVFRSNVIEPWDYHQVDDIKYIDAFSFDEEVFQDSLLFLKKKYAYKVEIDRIEKGDFATIRCQSEMKRFQKEKITLNVGKNLYSKELEDQLLGLSKGEKKICLVNGKEVETEVLKVERSVLPELTDTFIDQTFQEFSSFADLKDWYENDQKKTYLEEQSKQAAEAVCKEVIAKSSFEIDEEERQEARAEGNAIIEEMWNFNGLPLDQMTEEQVEEILGYPSVQEYRDWFMGINEESFYLSLLGYEMLEREGNLPDQKAYEETVRQYCEEEGKTEEEMKLQFPFRNFMKQRTAETYQDRVTTYIYEKLKETVL